VSSTSHRDGLTARLLTRAVGPASVPVHSPAAAAHPRELVAGDLTAAILEQKTVYDPFVGGGTTPAAAQQLGRVASGLGAWPPAVRLAQQHLAEAA
jgi:DNA modification methylase